MPPLRRLRRLEQLFESLYRCDQLRVMKLHERKAKVASRQERLIEALSSDNPCLQGFVDQLLADSVRQSVEPSGIETELAQTVRDSAPRKAQLERVRRQISGALTELDRQAEKHIIDEISSRNAADLE